MSPHLEVSGADLAKALAHITKGVRPGAKPGKGVVGFREGMLRIGVSGVTGKAPAAGTWDGEARVPGTFILGMARMPPAAVRVTLTVESGELRVQAGETALSVPCAWERASPTLVAVSTERTLLDTYRLSLTKSEAELEEMRLKTEVADVRRLVERKVREAAASLAGLGVTEENVREFVRQQAMKGSP